MQEAVKQSLIDEVIRKREKEKERAQQRLMKTGNDSEEESSDNQIRSTPKEPKKEDEGLEHIN